MKADERGIPYGIRCGSYTPGHDVHYIQARLSAEHGMGMPARIERVDDDGTIRFVDGSTLWNHDPERLRAILDRFGNDAFLMSRGVLRLPNGTGAYLICVAEAPDPCRADTATVIPGESLADELRRRGGFLRSVTPNAANASG
jgi:hypothetical protein